MARGRRQGVSDVVSPHFGPHRRPPTPPSVETPETDHESACRTVRRPIGTEPRSDSSNRSIRTVNRRDRTRSTSSFVREAPSDNSVSPTIGAVTCVTASLLDPTTPFGKRFRPATRTSECFHCTLPPTPLGSSRSASRGCAAPQVSDVSPPPTSADTCASPAPTSQPSPPTEHAPPSSFHAGARRNRRRARRDGWNRAIHPTGGLDETAHPSVHKWGRRDSIRGHGKRRIDRNRMWVTHGVGV